MKRWDSLKGQYVLFPFGKRSQKVPWRFVQFCLFVLKNLCSRRDEEGLGPWVSLLSPTTEFPTTVRPLPQRILIQFYGVSKGWCKVGKGPIFNRINGIWKLIEVSRLFELRLSQTFKEPQGPSLFVDLKVRRGKNVYSEILSLKKLDPRNMKIVQTPPGILQLFEDFNVRFKTTYTKKRFHS